MDLGGQETTTMTVDGVQGRLWRLGSQDFIRPRSNEAYKALIRDWEYDRSFYTSILTARSSEFNPFSGEAIALQWNREGVHYLIFARDMEPITEDVILEIANSMASATYPSLHEIHSRTPRCSS